MALSRLKWSLLFFILFSLVNCTSIDVIMLHTTDYQKNVATESVVDVPLDDAQEMTMMLKELLYPAELKQLYAYYGQEISIEAPTTPNGDIVGAAKDVTDFTMMHTDLWQQAAARGKVIETGLLILGSMFLIDSAREVRAPDRKISGIYMDGLLNEPDQDEVRSISNTLATNLTQSFISHLVALGYEFEGVAICMDANEAILKQTFQSRKSAKKVDCPMQPSISEIDVTQQHFYHFLFKLSDSNEARSMEDVWPNKVIVETYFNPLQGAKSSKDESFFLYSKPGGWQINVFHAPYGLTDDAFTHYRGFRRSAGTDFYRAIHYRLSKEMPEYFSFYRSLPNKRFHLAEGFYQGRLYRIEESLSEEASIIRGRVEGFDSNNIFIGGNISTQSTVAAE